MNEGAREKAERAVKFDLRRSRPPTILLQPSNKRRQQQKGDHRGEKSDEGLAPVIPLEIILILFQRVLTWSAQLLALKESPRGKSPEISTRSSLNGLE